MPADPNNPLPIVLAAQAELIVNTLQQTDYQHIDNIDVAEGVYDCDCNGFAAFVLREIAPLHLNQIPSKSGESRPLAYEYYDFFASLSPLSTTGWQRIERLEDAQRGDMMAWRFPKIERGHDTGHVVFLASAPTVNESLGASVMTARVYDSAAQPHFDDTRGPGPTQFETGVGSGLVNFQVDIDGRPVAFQFAPGDQFATFPIAVARAEAAAL